jgi:hypothetical protein
VGGGQFDKGCFLSFSFVCFEKKKNCDFLKQTFETAHIFFEDHQIPEGRYKL